MGHEFRNKPVRDLAWTISSPSLLRPILAPDGAMAVSDEWCRDAYKESENWLRHLDRSPEELQQWLDTHSSRLLGVRFERLIEFWLRHWRRSRVLAARAEVTEGLHAVGEFDFLWADSLRRRTIHWEVAVKYYLQYTDTAGRVSFLGPNPRDTLEKKFNRLVSHQLRLSDLPQASPLLARLGTGKVTAEAFVKGYLFYPSEGEWRHPVSSAPISPEHMTGWWTKASQGKVPRHDPTSRWLVLPRLDWLAPARRDERLPGLDWFALQDVLKDHFGNPRHPPVLLAELVPAEAGIWLECSRGFVVPDYWPGRRPRRARKRRESRSQALSS